MRHVGLCVTHGGVRHKAQVPQGRKFVTPDKSYALKGLTALSAGAEWGRFKHAESRCSALVRFLSVLE